MPPRIIDSKLYKRCPACHFEEKHIVSCLIKALEEKLTAVEEWKERNEHANGEWPDFADWPGLDRILQGGE